MVKIEITHNDAPVVIDVPESWDDITLGHYDTFHALEPKTQRETVELVAKVCKVDPQILFDAPEDLFNIIVSYAGFLFEKVPAEPTPVVHLNGTAYVVKIEDKLSFGEWIDADEVHKSGENVVTGTLAIVCRPVGEAYNPDNNDDRQAFFAAQPVTPFLGVLAFFLHYKNALDAISNRFSAVADLAEYYVANTKNLRRNGGGTASWPTWREIRLRILMRLLRYRLRRYLRSSVTKSPVKVRKTRKKS